MMHLALRGEQGTGQLIGPFDRLQAFADIKTGDAHLDAMKAAACKNVARRELEVSDKQVR